MARALSNNYQLNILKHRALRVTEFDEDLKSAIAAMQSALHSSGAVSVAANILGILKRIVVVAFSRESESFVFVNPKITWSSEGLIELEETSPILHGVSAKISRPQEIVVEYQDESGNIKEIKCDKAMARILQYEIDHLDCKTFLNRVSKIKQDFLLRKLAKQQSRHVHSNGCCDH